MNPPVAEFHPRLARRKVLGGVFAIACQATTWLGVLVLLVLIARVVYEGWPFLTWHFLNSFPSQISPETSGIKSALFGTLWLIALTAVVCVPVGVGAATYLQEFAPRTRLTSLIEVNIANLAGVPSVVYGLLGLAIFVRWLRLGPSILAGALTMSLVVLPVVIIASREALVAVPSSIRAAAFALGATRWQTVRSHVLTSALPGMMTGVILALSRAIGEAAPLIIVGGAAFVRFVPSGPLDNFTVLPLQIYSWSEQPGSEFARLAAAAIIVLLAVLVPMNAVAIGVRAWQQGKRN